MATETSPNRLPVAAEFETRHDHGDQPHETGESYSQEADQTFDAMEQPADEARQEIMSPGAVDQPLDDCTSDEDDVPPVPPVPQQHASMRRGGSGSGSRSGSRSRVRRTNIPKDYSSDPQVYTSQMYGQRPPRPKQPRFEDDEAFNSPEGGYGSDRAWREEIRHPDSYDRRYPPRSRVGPPRSHMNQQRGQMSYEQQSTPEKHWLEESQSSRSLSNQYHDPFSPRQPPPPRWYSDEEQGYGPYTMRPYPSTDSPRIQWNELTKEQKAEVLRLPWSEWMNSEVKNHFVASLGEFVGTTMFLFFAFAGTGVANIQSESTTSNSTTGGVTGFNISVQMYIALAFGMSLMVNVWIFFRVSGGLFNPAVTLALVMIRAISVVRALCLFFAQIVGGIVASVLVKFLFPVNFNVRTTISGGTSIAQGLFIEALLTAELVFTIYMLAAEKHRATFIAPVGIGMALFIAEMAGVQFTGGSLNPARSFGPCVASATFDTEHWIYWVGPGIGTCIAWFVYKLIKMLEYETANPGADGDPLNDPTKNPEKRAELNLARQKSSLSSVRKTAYTQSI